MCLSAMFSFCRVNNLLLLNVGFLIFVYSFKIFYKSTRYNFLQPEDLKNFIIHHYRLQNTYKKLINLYRSNFEAS